VLSALGDLLELADERHHLVVIGGSGLVAIGAISRPTRDVDVDALIDREEPRDLADLRQLAPTSADLTAPRAGRGRTSPKGPMTTHLREPSKPLELRMRAETLNAEVVAALQELAWDRWAQLGLSGAMPARPEERAADPEALLLFTLEIGRTEPTTLRRGPRLARAQRAADERAPASQPLYEPYRPCPRRRGA
jgi:hypothetical protein